MALRISNFHENYQRPEKFQQGSEKTFGLIIGSFFFIMVAVSWLLRQSFHLGSFQLGSLLVGFVFMALALTKPSCLKILNHQWSKLGLLLNKLISPLVLLVLFFLVFLPIALLLKLFKKDILNLKIEKTLDSYWIASENNADSMKDQF